MQSRTPRPRAGRDLPLGSLRGVAKTPDVECCRLCDEVRIGLQRNSATCACERVMDATIAQNSLGAAVVGDDSYVVDLDGFERLYTTGSRHFTPWPLCSSAATTARTSCRTRCSKLSSTGDGARTRSAGRLVPSRAVELLPCDLADAPGSFAGTRAGSTSEGDGRTARRRM